MPQSDDFECIFGCAGTSFLKSLVELFLSTFVIIVFEQLKPGEYRRLSQDRGNLLLSLGSGLSDHIFVENDLMKCHSSDVILVVCSSLFRPDPVMVDFSDSLRPVVIIIINNIT